MLTVHAIDHLVLNVQDVETSAAWYGRVLGMERHDDAAPSGDVRTSVRFGAHKINLRPADASPQLWFTARCPAPGGADLCLLTTSSPDEVARHLRGCDVEPELGPVTRSGAQGAIRSVYCRDPDGNLIELSSYE